MTKAKAKADKAVEDKGTPGAVTMRPLGTMVGGTRAAMGWQVTAEGQTLYYGTTAAMMADLNDYISNPNAFRDKVTKGLGF